MNKVKLSLWVASVAVITSFANRTLAQEKPVTIGLKGGVNLSTFGGSFKDAKSSFRYQFGVTADIALSHNLYLLTGLDLQTKGAKWDAASASALKYKPVYLQLPVALGYKLNLSEHTKFVLNAGPYAAYGIGGNAKGDGGKDKTSLFGKDGFKKLDYGVIGGAGVELGKIALNVGYEYGIANINRGSGPKVTNRNPYLTIGYKF